jgi:hypothetical protein
MNYIFYIEKEVTSHKYVYVSVFIHCLTLLYNDHAAGQETQIGESEKNKSGHVALFIWVSCHL